MTDLKSIAPKRAAELIRAGAVLVDIREAGEHARERIPGARHHALSKINAEGQVQPGDDVVIFHCGSGARTQANAQRLAAGANGAAYVLEGGLDAWKKAGLPVAVDRSQPIELMRQVQIAAGSLVVLGAILGFLISPGFHVLSGLVGVGFVFAGVSGFCGMARILAAMPWNRRTAGPPAGAASKR
jgi:rhodanese-related sulfurtransferase